MQAGVKGKAEERVQYRFKACRWGPMTTAPGLDLGVVVKRVRVSREDRRGRRDSEMPKRAAKQKGEGALNGLKLARSAE